MSLDTQMLSQILFGKQRQSGRYQNVICELTANILVEKNFLDEASLSDEAKCAYALRDMLNQVLVGKVKIPRSLLCMLIGLDGYDIYAGAEKGTVAIKLTRLSPVTDQTNHRYSIEVVTGGHVQATALTYKEMVVKIIDAYKTGAPEWCVSDTQRAMTVLLAKVDHIDLAVITGVEMLHKVEATFVKWANMAPVSLAAEGLSRDECAIYAYAIGHDIDVQRIEERLRFTSCRKAVRSFLQDMEFNTDAVQTVLFGRQKQGDAMIVTITALVCKMLMANNCAMLESDTGGMCATIISKAFEKQLNRGNRSVDPLIDVVTGGEASKVVNEVGNADIHVIADCDSSNGRYLFKCTADYDAADEYEE